MRVSSHFVLLSGAATIALLAGCSSGGAQAPPPGASDASLSGAARAAIGSNARKGFVNVAGVNAPGGNQVIVSDSQNNTVSVYGATGALNALLTAGLTQPVGLATDANQNLYVANGQGFDVLVYSKPYKAARLTLADPGLYPDDVAVSQTGVVAVMASVANPYGPGAVRLYAPGSASSCATIGDPGWHGMTFGAFDASGNLFFDGFDNGGNPLVGEIVGGCSATSVVTLGIGNTLANPQGVQVVAGNVLVLDQEYNTFTPTIYTYAPPKGGSLGSPITTTKLSAGIEMTTFAMTLGDGDLWIAHSDAAAGRIQYSYPGGHFVKSFNEDNLVSAFGIAVNPAAKP